MDKEGPIAELDACLLNADEEREWLSGTVFVDPFLEMVGEACAVEE